MKKMVKNAQNQFVSNERGFIWQEVWQEHKKIRNRSSLYWDMLGLGHILKGKWRHFFLLDAPLYSFCALNFWIFFIQITTTSTVEKNWTPRSISDGMF